MKHTISIAGILILCIISICILQSPLMAQQENKDASQSTIFSNQKRPIPPFDHDLHEEAFGDSGCAKCHHIQDEASGKLVYSEGDESACAECHAAEPAEDILAIREASHASCTGCHRTLIKEKKAAGPTTCGECHKK